MFTRVSCVRIAVREVNRGLACMLVRCPWQAARLIHLNVVAPPSSTHVSKILSTNSSDGLLLSQVTGRYRCALLLLLPLLLLLLLPLLGNGCQSRAKVHVFLP